MMNGLIITAGLSSRMGKFKPLLKFNGKSFLENIILKLNSSCDKIVIVTGFNSEVIYKNISEFSSELKSKINVVHNPDYEIGMFTSLQKGLENCSSDWVIYHFVDQPNLPEMFYSDFTNQINLEYDWIQPINNGRKGHPILINKKLQEKIGAADQNSNLREISNSNDIKKYFWECEYQEIFSDIDTADDFNKLKTNNL